LSIAKSVLHCSSVFAHVRIHERQETISLMANTRAVESRSCILTPRLSATRAYVYTYTYIYILCNMWFSIISDRVYRTISLLIIIILISLYGGFLFNFWTFVAYFSTVISYIRFVKSSARIWGMFFMCFYCFTAILY